MEIATKVTLKFKDNKIMIPCQEDAENIAIAVSIAQGVKNIHFDSFKLGDHLYLEWSNVEKAWIIEPKSWQ